MCFYPVMHNALFTVRIKLDFLHSPLFTFLPMGLAGRDEIIACRNCTNSKFWKELVADCLPPFKCYLNGEVSKRCTLISVPLRDQCLCLISISTNSDYATFAAYSQNLHLHRVQSGFCGNQH